MQTGVGPKQQVRQWRPKGEDVIKTYDVTRMLSLNSGNLQVGRKDAKELEGRTAHGGLTRREKGEKQKKRGSRK